MKAAIKQHLQEVAAEVFESLAFLLAVEPPEQPLAAPDAAMTAANIRFVGPFSGQLLLEVTPGLLPALASNMLAEPQPNLQQQQDAFKEALNVICGNLLPRISCPQDIFHVHPPAILPPDMTAAAKGQSLAEASISLDAGNAHLALCLDQGGWERGTKESM